MDIVIKLNGEESSQPLDKHHSALLRLMSSSPKTFEICNEVIIGRCLSRIINYKIHLLIVVDLSFILEGPIFC